MSFFATKTILAVLFIAAGLTAALSMLTLMGKAERRMGVMALRNTHRAAGYVFATLLVVLAVMGLKYLAAAGDSLPLRGVLHWSLASLLLFVLALKLVVVRWFKQFVKFVPVMGMTVITLALVVAMLSAVFFVVTGGSGARESRALVSSEVRYVEEEPQVVVEEAVEEVVEEAVAPAEQSAVAPTSVDPGAVAPAPAGQGSETSADAAEGGRVFVRSCSGCHYDDSADAKIGPGLAGLFERDVIAVSGMPVSGENVRDQIVSPTGRMPSFEAYLSGQQLDDLIAYLQTL